MSAEKAELTVEDSIKQAFAEVEEKNEAPEPEEEDAAPSKDEGRDTGSGRERDEGGKFTKQAKEKAEKQETPEKNATEPENQALEKTVAAPQSWSAQAKSQWAGLPDGVKAEIVKRESDIHRKLTSNEEDFNLGKSMKEIITPYMPIITAEGGTPAKAVQSLLNTAYQLRTAPPAQKAALIKQIATQYGVDWTQVNQQQAPVDPVMQQITSRLDGIESKFTQQNTLQEQQEQARITSEIQAFAANPANTYFEQVRSHMAALMGSNQAKDLQEAYDKAIWANSEIRPILLATQQKEQDDKRKAELAKKKKAAVSVTGSPGVSPPNSEKPKSRTVEEDLREVMDDVLASKF